MKDGTRLDAGGYPVGFCTICRYNQTTLLFLQDKGYCPSCFPKAVDIMVAMKKLEELSKLEDV